MTRVSFIVPLYNAEKTIETTLATILAQKIQDCEILLINDGSADHTEEILRRKAAEDPRIRVLSHETNKGVAAARNTGLANARGEFVRFIDADDLVPPASTRRMLAIAKKRRADMVMGVMRRQSAVRAYNYGRTVRVAEKKFFDKYDENLIHSFSLCNKLFRRSIIEEHQVRFLPYKHAEDGLFLYDFLQYADRLCGYKGIAYVYIKPEFFEAPSTTQHLSREMLDGVLEVADRILAMHPDAPQQFVDHFRARILGITLINEYYRKLWRMSNDQFALLMEEIKRYWALLPEQQRKAVAAMNNDLPAPDRLGGKQEICKNPMYLIMVDKTVSAKHLPVLLESIYYQREPSFVVLLHPSHEEVIPGKYLEAENCIVARSEDEFLAAGLGGGTCKYIARVQSDVTFTYETLFRAYQELSRGAECVKGQVYYYDGALHEVSSDEFAPMVSAITAGEKKAKSFGSVKFVVLAERDTPKRVVPTVQQDNLRLAQMKVYGSILKHKLKSK